MNTFNDEVRGKNSLWVKPLFPGNQDSLSVDCNYAAARLVLAGDTNVTMIPHPFALFRSDANDSAPPFEFGIVCLWSLVGLMLTGFFLAWGSGIDISQALVPGG